MMQAINKLDLRPGGLNYVDGEFSLINSKGAISWRPTRWYERAWRAVLCRLGFHAWRSHQVTDEIFETGVVTAYVDREWHQCDRCRKVKD